MQETCNKMVYQDDTRIRCYLPKDHRGECQQRPAPAKLSFAPAKTKREVYVEDPHFMEISNGNGLILTVPKWVADYISITAQFANQIRLTDIGIMWANDYRTVSNEDLRTLVANFLEARREAGIDY